MPCHQILQMEGNILLVRLLSLFTDQLNHESLDAVDYLQEEFRVLKLHLKKRPAFTDAQRKELAEKAK